jgi:hypothetical protein
MSSAKIDGLVKSRKFFLSVIRAKAGIQAFHLVQHPWIPFFNGMTTFFECIKIPFSKKPPHRACSTKLASMPFRPGNVIRKTGARFKVSAISCKKFPLDT